MVGENQYIIELLEKLDKTEIWKSNREKYKEYSKGIDVLVELFIRHKKINRRYFLLEMEEVRQLQFI